MVSDEQLIQDLKTFADELGETPTSKQMKADGPWSTQTYQRHFGSWNKALKEAGIKPVQEYSDSKRSLIDDLQNFADEIDNVPGWREMREEGPWSPNIYQNHFGSWNAALKEAGLEIQKEQQHSKDDLIEDLQEFSDEIGRVPTYGDMNSNGPWSTSTYENHFGSWTEAVKKAGFEPIAGFVDSKRELIEDLQQFSEKIGETPTAKQMRDDGPWNVSTYQDYFGSWNQAVKKAGLETKIIYSDSKNELIQDLQEFASEIGETPSQCQMDEEGPWTSFTYCNHFGSWNQALREAGLEPIQEYPVEPEWGDDVDDYYGQSWPEMREEAVQRDNKQCRVCSDDELVHVHHIKPRRCFEDPDNSNTLDNLITLCVSCHGRFEGRWTDTDPDEFESNARELLRVE